jgi:hypothetical protein
VPRRRTSVWPSWSLRSGPREHGAHVEYPLIRA